MVSPLGVKNLGVSCVGEKKRRDQEEKGSRQTE